MSTAQIIIIAIGLLIVASSVDFKSLFAFLKLKEKEVIGYAPVAPTPTPAPTPVPVVVVDTKNELVLLVQKWQALKDACDKNNLTEASAKLDEIFPVLIKVEKS